MIIRALMASAFIVLATTASAQVNTVNAGNGWTCTATNLLDARYNGGNTAYIHLSPYSDGRRYAVIVSGNRATGQTSNGTPFVCTRN